MLKQIKNEQKASENMKSTKIIATIGPVSASYEMLEKLAQAGANIFRLNFSHGDHDWHGKVIKNIKRLNKKAGYNIAILLDTKGPEIRTGDLQTPKKLQKKSTIILTTESLENPENSEKIEVNYEAFVEDVTEGDTILVDNGEMTLKVLEIKNKDVFCEVLDGGILGSRRHLNIPGKDVSLESITEKDWKDIAFGVEMGVDFIALSFVRRATEINTLREYLKSKKSSIDIIPKIECLEATKHLGTILEASDGVMVARGDLGAEIPFAQVPQVQRDIVNLAAKFKKPVIVATHMLESMIKSPMPTRAEITDIAEAVWQSSDAIMLSGETAGGKYPEKSVQTMAAIAIETEKNPQKINQYKVLEATDERSEFAKVAVKMAADLLEVVGVLVITRGGTSARHVSNFRPNVPIFAFTNESGTKRKMCLFWGVYPFRIAFSQTPQVTIDRAREKLKEKFPEYKGKKMVIVSDFLVNDIFTPTLQIQEI